VENGEPDLARTRLRVLRNILGRFDSPDPVDIGEGVEMVDLIGIEPTTSSLRTTRSPS
jgi:hypothetical protein